MKKIYLLRHTAVAVPPKHFYGRTDVPLAETFPEEAVRLRNLLPKQLDMPVFSSPLSRCRRLADELFSEYDTDERLLELDFGEWEMKSWEEIPATDRDHYLANFDKVPPPNGELFSDLQARAVNFLDELMAAGHAEAAIVAHSGVIRSLLCHVMKMPLGHLYNFDLAYGSLSTIVKDWKSVRVGQVNV